MAIDPHLFTGMSRSRTKLRDFVIDLNQSKNFDEIVIQVHDALVKAAKDQRYARLILAAHSSAELKRIIATNLRRLHVDYSDLPNELISGASEDFDWLWPWEKEFWDWWDEALFGKDEDEGDKGEDEDKDDPDDPYDLDKVLNKNERDQLEQVMDEMDGK